MTNINFEDFIKDLSPELMEKAKACKTADELLKLADENDIELPNEALEAVSGGCGGKTPDVETYNDKFCPGCGNNSFEVTLKLVTGGMYLLPAYSYKCTKCGKVSSASSLK